MGIKGILRNERIVRNLGNIVIWSMLINLIIKTIVFISIATSKNGYWFEWYEINFKLAPAHVGMLIFFVVFAYLFKNRNQLRYLILLDAVYTALLFILIYYYRASGEYFGLRHILFEGLFNPLNRSLINPSILDLLLILDFPILIYILRKKDIFDKKKRKLSIVTVGVIFGIISNVVTCYMYDIKKIDKKVNFMSVNSFADRELRNMWPIGYEIFDAFRAIKKYTIKADTTKIDTINNWFEVNNEKLPKNEYYGKLEGKSIIYLQMESLESFVLNRKIYGQEITPNLNKLINESLYFSNFYEQNNKGSSIDCDLMVNTSVLPLGQEITLIKNPYTRYPSMARILDANGYESISNHAEPPGDFNWAEAHSNALGFNKVLSIKDYKMGEKVGYGLSDEDFYTQFLEKIDEFKKPFFTMIPNLSNHGPFDIQEKYRKLKLPQDLDKTKLGGYFQSVHYADEQLGIFIDKLNEKGYMDDLALIIYGDHGGIHKYYNKELKNIKIEGEWWRINDKKLPLLIHAKGLKPEKIDTYGGQIDVMPTTLALLGIDSNVPLMGRNLLNTKINGTVIKGNKILGDVSKEEEKYLKEAYKIGEYIILNNYYDYENKIKN